MAASTNFPAIAASADPRITRACFSRSAWACRDMASCKATGIATSRISTAFTEIPQSAVLPPISKRLLRDPIDGFMVIGDVQGRFLRVMDKPENDRVHVHRNGILRQRLLGAERRGLNALVDDGDNVVDDRNDQEQSGAFDAAQFSGAKDDELLPGVCHL